MKKNLTMFLWIASGSLSMPLYSSHDYRQEVTHSEREAVTYILDTLANDSMPSLLFSESELQAAGDRTKDVHPLKYFTLIFSDPILRHDFHKMHSRNGMIWSRFEDGMIKNLASKSHYTHDEIEDFYGDPFLDDSLF